MMDRMNPEEWTDIYKQLVRFESDLEGGNDEGLQEVLSMQKKEANNEFVKFYEDNYEVKIVASRRILILTLDMKNLEFLINHDSLIGTICRTLKDDYKKSMDLCIYLQCIFFIFSNYQDFHSILL